MSLRGYAPASSADRPGGSSADETDDDEDSQLDGKSENDGGAERDDQAQDMEQPPMTAAESRAQKRKMKRFRLTHNQTRFLMSEFARQMHPDAAHRERLSREIPGLNPRQVQVWFQNRRAKLKRLTTDDRERMMRSRALPEDFDMTHALHSTFGASQPPRSMSLPSLEGSDSLPPASVRPLTLDTLRRVPDYSSHPSQRTTFVDTATATFNNGGITSQRANDITPPALLMGDYSVPNFEYRTPSGEQTYQSIYRTPTPNLSDQVRFQAAIPRVHGHGGPYRPRADMAASSLRTSTSCTSLQPHYRNLGSGCSNPFVDRLEHQPDAQLGDVSAADINGMDFAQTDPSYYDDPPSNGTTFTVPETVQYYRDGLSTDHEHHQPPRLSPMQIPQYQPFAVGVNNSSHSIQPRRTGSSALSHPLSYPGHSYQQYGTGPREDFADPVNIMQDVLNGHGDEVDNDSVAMY